MSSADHTNLSGVETLARVVCLACIAGAIWAGASLVPHSSGSLYGGTAVFVSFVFMAQVAMLVIVGLAVAVKKSGAAPVLSRQGKGMIGVTVLIVLAEGIALALIPTSGAS